jgi:hypothetical protein
MAVEKAWVAFGEREADDEIDDEIEQGDYL